MPAKSKSQERLMQAVAHNPEFAKKVGIAQKVGKEFVGHAEGGEVAPPDAGGYMRVNEEVAAAEAGMTVAEYRAALARTRAKAAAPASDVRFDKPRQQSAAERDAGLAAALKKRGFAAGGSIDGCAQRGKTRAKRS
jgi:hypothetical protein